MKAKHGALGSWRTRQGDDITSWSEFDRLTKPGPASFVNVESPIPARVQILWHRVRLALIRVLNDLA